MLASADVIVVAVFERFGGGGAFMLKTGAWRERLVVGWAKLPPGVKGIW